MKLHRRTFRSDVLIVGAGTCGLMIGARLAARGRTVSIVERSPLVASQSSGRNEGWLHRGTYHANSIVDRQEALRVARRCAYGYSVIRSYAPEAIENIERPATALVMDEDRRLEAESRWDSADIPFRKVSLKDARAELGLVDLSRACAAYRVHDSALNTRVLNTRLLRDCRAYGAQLLLNHTFDYRSDGSMTLTRDGVGAREVDAKTVVLTVGYGVGLLAARLPFDLSIRYWKSHILYGPAVCEQPVFWLDPFEATVMQHEPGVSVIGLNEDSYEVELPNIQVEPHRAQMVYDSLQRLVPNAGRAGLKAAACIKIDVGDRNTPRSVNARMFHRPGLILALPGKLTESPFVADMVVRHLGLQADDDSVARRPWEAKVDD